MSASLKNHNKKNCSKNNTKDPRYRNQNLSGLQADCENCFGFCCVALFFCASEGFPTDKEAGKPCLHLQPDFLCGIHENLRQHGLKGCSSFDCFGAGPKTARITFEGKSWREDSGSSQQMFEVYLIMRQLHEMLWYLGQPLTLRQAPGRQEPILAAIEETEKLTHLGAEELLALDVASHREKVSLLLREISEEIRTKVNRGRRSHCNQNKKLCPGADLVAADLRKTDLIGVNLRGACLIAANLRGSDLTGTDLLGADLRDADLCGADLSESIFLTQAQLNVAKGDEATRLPDSLSLPSHWISR